MDRNICAAELGPRVGLLAVRFRRHLHVNVAGAAVSQHSRIPKMPVASALLWAQIRITPSSSCRRTTKHAVEQEEELRRHSPARAAAEAASSSSEAEGPRRVREWSSERSRRQLQANSCEEAAQQAHSGESLVVSVKIQIANYIQEVRAARRRACGVGEVRKVEICEGGEASGGEEASEGG
jgi:hypothetical protein